MDRMSDLFTGEIGCWHGMRGIEAPRYATWVESLRARRRRCRRMERKRVKGMFAYMRERLKGLPYYAFSSKGVTTGFW